MLKQLSFLALAGALAGNLFVAPSQAAPPPRNSDNRPAFLPQLPGKIFTTRAKVAYYFSRGGGADTSKNVAKFTNPSTGVYCITPSVMLGYPDVYPHVTVDWGNSIGNVLFAYILLHSDDCPAGPFEVLPYNDAG